MSSLTLPMRGKCYCGTVTYKMEADPIFVNCCHCRDCQTLSGSAFAVNIMIEAENIQVSSSTKPITKSDGRAGREAQDAKSMHCPTCGTMLFATHSSFGDNLVFVRAGTLEEADKITPTAHFFTRSKHPWVILPEGVPAFDALPTAEDGPLWTEEAKKRIDAASAKKV
jgi:hypothetical protein